MTTFPAHLEHDLPALCRWAAHEFGPRLTLATSLGREDMVLLHALGAASRDLPSEARPDAFLLDTGRLHEETYLFLDRVQDQFGLRVRVLVPRSSALESLYASHGAFGFRSSVDARQACCAVRKVEPLGRALRDRAAWMTGLRRAQSQTRQLVPVAELDTEHRLKLAPLAAWSTSDVGGYLRTHGVPEHPLHAEGFPSIGCEPCTRAIRPGESERAGRWWWESPDSKECGLHPIQRRRSPVT